MYCAACGGRIERPDEVCPACRADLAASGAVRFTSSSQDPQHLSEVFTQLEPPAEWFDDAEETRTTPRNPLPRERLRLVPLPDPDATRPRRLLTAVVLGVCLALAAGVVGAVRWAQQVIDAPIREARAAASAPVSTPSRTPTPSPTPSELSLPATTPSAEPTEQETGYRANALPAAAKHCSSMVGANSRTSCGFAEAVADALPEKPKGSFRVKATSPVTGQRHTLDCTADALVICSGGQAIQVYVIY